MRPHTQLATAAMPRRGEEREYYSNRSRWPFEQVGMPLGARVRGLADKPYARLFHALREARQLPSETRPLRRGNLAREAHRAYRICVGDCLKHNSSVMALERVL
jgi:hypothetical protein